MQYPHFDIKFSICKTQYWQCSPIVALNFEIRNKKLVTNSSGVSVSRFYRTPLRFRQFLQISRIRLIDFGVSR